MKNDFFHLLVILHMDFFNMMFACISIQEVLVDILERNWTNLSDMA